MNDEQHKQFAGAEGRAMEILEQAPWGDLEYAIRDVEVALALLLEATAPWRGAWEESLEEMYEDEFGLTKEQVEDLSDTHWHVYVARLVETLCMQYGVTSRINGPDRNAEVRGDPLPPLEWGDDEAPANQRTHGIARILHGLNDLLDQLSLDGRTP